MKSWEYLYFPKQNHIVVGDEEFLHQRIWPLQKFYSSLSHFVQKILGSHFRMELRIVLPKMEELISQPFLDENSIWKLFWDRVDLWNGVGGVSLLQAPFSHFFSLLLMRISNGQKWFLRPFFALIRGMFLLKNGLRLSFQALEVPEPRGRKRPI